MSVRRITIEDVRARRQEILRILAAKGAENPRIFGSVARGTADEKSDVDLLVDLIDWPAIRGFRNLTAHVLRAAEAPAGAGHRHGRAAAAEGGGRGRARCAPA